VQATQLRANRVREGDLPVLKVRKLPSILRSMSANLASPRGGKVPSYSPHFATKMVQCLGTKTTALRSENPRSKRAPSVCFGWFSVGLECHPLLCMLLKIRSVVLSAPTTCKLVIRKSPVSGAAHGGVATIPPWCQPKEKPAVRKSLTAATKDRDFTERPRAGSASGESLSLSLCDSSIRRTWWWRYNPAQGLRGQGWSELGPGFSVPIFIDIQMAKGWLL